MPSKKELQEQILDLIPKSFMDLHIKIKKWYFTWKFPFIKKFEFHGTIDELHELENRMFNAFLDKKVP